MAIHPHFKGPFNKRERTEWKMRSTDWRGGMLSSSFSFPSIPLQPNKM